MTKVKFLIEKPEGDLPCNVFAFFPEIKGTNQPGMFTSYAHIGQHSACHIDYANECKEASPEQYADLKRELEGLGYVLEVINSPEPSPIGEEVEPNYYACQLDKVRVGLTEYSPTIKVFANGNGEDTKHMSLNDESAKTLIQWLKNSFPNCED